MIEKWQRRLMLGKWNIRSEKIMSEQVFWVDGGPFVGDTFTGICKEEGTATIYHDTPLKEDDVVHELLHLRFPWMSETWVNIITNILI